MSATASAAEVAWETSDAPAAAGDLASVDLGLEAANRAAADPSAARPLACFARSPSGDLAGRAVGRTLGAVCELRQLWVAPAWRGRGIGSALVRRVEAAARERGCSVLLLETFSFQAPGLSMPGSATRRSPRSAASRTASSSW